MTKLREKVSSQSRRNARLLIIVPWAIAALLTAPFAFFDVRTDVDLRIVVSEVLLTLADDPGRIATSVHTQTLNVQRFANARLGLGEFESPLRISGDLRLVANDPFVAMTLENVTVREISTDAPAGQGSTAPRVIRLKRQSGELTISSEDVVTHALLSTDRQLVVRCDECSVGAGGTEPDERLPKQATWLPAPMQGVTVSSGTDGMTLTFDAVPGTEPLKGQLRLARIDFSDSDDARHTSSVLSGEVKYASVGLDPRPIQKRDYVEAELADNAWLREARVVEEGIEVAVEGSVRRLDIGPAGRVRSALPSGLEWVYARQRWLLYFQAIGAVAASLIGAWRLWRGTPSS